MHTNFPVSLCLESLLSPPPGQPIDAHVVSHTLKRAWDDPHLLPPRLGRRVELRLALVALTDREKVRRPFARFLSALIYYY